MTFKGAFKVCFLQLSSLDFTPAQFLRESWLNTDIGIQSLFYCCIHKQGAQTSL